MKVKVQHPEYIMFSSDYSQQEPKILAYVSKEPSMCDAFTHGRDIYATIASIAFNRSYEDCLEFNPETGEYQAEGKERRSQAKSIVLGITYGRSTVTIGEQLFGRDHEMSDEDKTRRAQEIYDSVLKAFPSLKNFMEYAQNCARVKGYTETILGRRRHIPDMQLKPFEFKAMPGYVNPDVDPLDVETLKNSSDIPDRIVKELEADFAKTKYYGQVVKKTKALREQHIKVINNKRKITDATRQCVNCVDFDTEILTTSGWRRYSDVHEGDSIISYNPESGFVENDTINAVHIYTEGPYDVTRYKSSTFESVSTTEHRWVVRNPDGSSKFVTTERINSHKWPDFPILRVWDNLFNDNDTVPDDVLTLLGWLMTDGSYSSQDKPYHMRLYQSTSREKGNKVYHDIVNVLHRLGITFSDSTRRSEAYHEIYLYKCDITEWVRNNFPSRILTFDFVSTLSQRQAKILLKSMMQGDGCGDLETGEFVCGSESKRDVFQYLCFVAGYASNSYTCDSTSRKCRGSVDNSEGYIQSTKPYYCVSVLKIKNAQIYPEHRTPETVDGVWCVTTGNGTWVARRSGKVYITGNSIIQGSAADLTKMAILNLELNPRWHQIGGRLLVPVHDELICEVPVDFYEEGRKLLKDAMEGAGNFLPFPISCDVETTLRWYGLEYPCPYVKPNSFSLETLSDLSEDEICWIQYHLLESEYQLPKFPDKDGNAPIGNAAKGISGQVSDEMINAIKDYMKLYSVSEQSFIDHIETLVQKGTVKHEV